MIAFCTQEEVAWTHSGETRGGEVAEAELLAQVFLNAKVETATSGPILAFQEAEKEQSTVTAESLSPTKCKCKFGKN